jgi:hypothetical protein
MIETAGQFCELQSAWIIPRQTSSNSQTERGFFSEAGGVHENHPCGVRMTFKFRAPNPSSAPAVASIAALVCQRLADNCVGRD